MIGKTGIEVDVDFRSSSWIAIRDWTRQKLDACRIKNDAALSSEETAMLRGTIAAYKDLLAVESRKSDASTRPLGLES